MHPDYPITFGKYLLLQRIAVGGMAEVFRAKLIGPKGFEKKLAIKRILPEYSQDDEFVQMFVDEARISSHLHHSNIVQVFDFGQVDHQFYLAMEIVDGTNLKNLFFRSLKQERHLSRPLIYYMVSKIASALEYAHQVKVDGEDHYLQLVHRDVSPQNVLISRRGEVKLTDFGIAKAAIKMTQTQPGKIQGKYSYMSPEQALGRSIDHRSDIFSLGIIFFELLSGKKVYGSSDSVDRYNQATKAEIPRLSKIVEGIPSQIDDLVMQMLSKDPKDRPKNCSIIVSTLASFLSTVQEDDLTKELGEITKDLFPPPPDAKVPDEVSTKLLQDKTNTHDNVKWEGKNLAQEKQAALAQETKDQTVREFALTGWLQQHKKKLIFIPLVLIFLGGVFALIQNAMNDPKVVSQRPKVIKRTPEVKNEFPDTVKLEMELIDIENEIDAVESKLKATKKISIPKNTKKTATTVAKKPRAKCPKGMKWIKSSLTTVGSSPGDSLKQELIERPFTKKKINGFCMDIYEYPNKKGQAPMTNVTFGQAVSKCKSAGKKLCTEPQWERACKGPNANQSNWQQPYGAIYKENACNVHEHDLIDHHDYLPAKSGNFQKCKSAEGIFDLSGSVFEWTSSSGLLSSSSKMTKGGSSHASTYAARCSSISEVSPDTRESDIGFRCCK